MSPQGSTSTPLPCVTTAVAPSSVSYLPPLATPGGAKKVIVGLISESKQATQPSKPSSAVAAGKRPARRLQVDVQAAESVSLSPHQTDADPSRRRSPHTQPQVPHSATAASLDTSTKLVPSLYKVSRGRSTNVSPSRRWDRRGASATVLSGTSGSGSGSGEESELTVAEAQVASPSRLSQNFEITPTQSSTRGSKPEQPTPCFLLAPTLPPRRPSITRRVSNARSGTASSRLSTTSRLTVEEEDSDNLTSSDEEGAHASRLARSRRASLERDRQRGMRILLAAARRGVCEKEASREDMVSGCASPGFTSASTSVSATPTTPDDLSEPSSALSRSPSSDLDFLSIPPSSLRRNRVQSEQGEAAFFGLADDEEDPTAAALSAQALSAALLKRRRSRTGSASGRFLTVDGSDRNSIHSLPESRRPSIPRNGNSSAGNASTSVPTGESTVLGFAPLSAANSSLGRRLGSPPRRRVPWALSMSFGQADKGAADLLSGSSVGSVEDYLKVEPVDWDDNETETYLRERRSSVVSVRSGSSPLLSAGGDVTVAAVEATSLLVAGKVSLTHESKSSQNLTAESSSSERSGDKSEAVSRSQSPHDYRQRLSDLQSQLRVLSTRGGAENLTSPSTPTAEESKSGLLASSWRQIARLPNLFFPGAKTQAASAIAALQEEEVGATVTEGPSYTGNLSDSEIFDSATISLPSPLSSPEASSITLPGDATPRLRPLGTRRSSLSSRGVLCPVEGDRDPGAYVSGLGERIDPDIELSSVVHLQSFRARGRSVDTSGPSRQHRHSAHYERMAASDSEGSPVLAVTKTGEKPPPLDLPQAVAALVISSHNVLPATSSKNKVRASFNLHDVDDEVHGPVSQKVHEAEKIPSHREQSPVTRAPPARSSCTEEKGFTTAIHRRRDSRSKDAIRASRPAAEALVPQDFSAFGDHPGSGSSDEEGSRHWDAPIAGVAHTAPSSPRLRDDTDDEQSSPGRDRRGRGGRGRSRQSSRGAETAPLRNRQCAIGLFTGRRASPTDDGSASVRSIRSSPNLTYAQVAAEGDANSRPRGSSRASGNEAVSRPPFARQRSDQGSSSDERSRTGRGRRDGVKVTSCSFSSDEHPRNSLPRSASNSAVLDSFKGGSLLKQKPLLSAPTGPAMSLPGTRSPSFTSGPSSFGGDGGFGSISPCPDALNPSPADIPQIASQHSALTHHQQQTLSGDVFSPPCTRHTLLSNSAHLLMLSLELEMMRAQKITAPLKVRWVRQRVTVNASSTLSSSASEPSAGEGTNATGVTSVIGIHSLHLYQPRKASRLRHSITTG